MDETKSNPKKRLIYTDEEVFSAARYAIEIGRKNRDTVQDLQRRVEELGRILDNLTKPSLN